ncbi:MAG: cupin [Gracilibacter sp. BRH_c7a]|nr:MAG: cupin [Gracilibacter sp. BRH_c7a]
MKKRVVCKKSEEGYISPVEGLKRRTLVYGRNSLMIEVKLEKGTLLTLHKHPQEQAGYLISGHLIFNIDGEKVEIHAGDSYCIPENLEHGVEAIEDSLVVEVFSPVREEFLP